MLEIEIEHTTVFTTRLALCVCTKIILLIQMVRARPTYGNHTKNTIGTYTAKCYTRTTDPLGTHGAVHDNTRDTRVYCIHTTGPIGTHGAAHYDFGAAACTTSIRRIQMEYDSRGTRVYDTHTTQPIGTQSAAHYDSRGALFVLHQDCGSIWNTQG